MSREKDDDYETPGWAVRAIWPHVRTIEGPILEPCAGRGALVEELLRLGVPRLDIYARELDPGRCESVRATLQARSLHTTFESERAAETRGAALVAVPRVRAGDWLLYDEPLRPRLVITNPPFKLALPKEAGKGRVSVVDVSRSFVDKSIRLVRSAPGRRWAGGTVAMLMRLDMLASQYRASWWRDNPADVYVLSRRPSYGGRTDGQTDKRDYAWFVWGGEQQRGHVRWLECEGS